MVFELVHPRGLNINNSETVDAVLEWEVPQNGCERGMRAVLPALFLGDRKASAFGRSQIGGRRYSAGSNQPKGSAVESDWAAQGPRGQTRVAGL